MTALEKVRQVLPPKMSAQEVEMARAAQRCIMEALDHSRAAAITLTTTDGGHPTVELPPAALKLIRRHRLEDPNLEGENKLTFEIIEQAPIPVELPMAQQES